MAKVTNISYGGRRVVLDGSRKPYYVVSGHNSMINAKKYTKRNLAPGVWDKILKINNKYYVVAAIPKNRIADIKKKL